MNLRSVVNKTNQLRAFQEDSNIIFEKPKNKATTLSELSGNYTTCSNVKSNRRGGSTMILINKDYTTDFVHLDTANTKAATEEDGDNCDVDIEMTLVQM